MSRKAVEKLRKHLWRGGGIVPDDVDIVRECVAVCEEGNCRGICGHPSCDTAKSIVKRLLSVLEGDDD